MDEWRAEIGTDILDSLGNDPSPSLACSSASPRQRRHLSFSRWRKKGKARIPWMNFPWEEARPQVPVQP